MLTAENVVTVEHTKEQKQGGKWVTIENYGTMHLTLKQFEQSFVKERWEGERRYDKKYTKYGYFHTKTIVNNPFDNSRSVRLFTFE